MKWLIFTRLLNVQGNTKAVTNGEIPNCSSFEFVKGNIQTEKIKMIKNNSMKDQYLKKDHIMTGQTVYTDNKVY